MRKIALLTTVVLAFLGIEYMAYAAGTTAQVTITYPTEGTRLSPITGQTETVPVALSEIQKAVIKWYVGTTLAGSVDLIAPATTVAVPSLVCGNYNFTAHVVLKAGTSGPDYAPPVAYATGVACTTVPKPPTVTVG